MTTTGSTKGSCNFSRLNFATKFCGFFLQFGGTSDWAESSTVDPSRLVACVPRMLYRGWCSAVIVPQLMGRRNRIQAEVKVERTVKETASAVHKTRCPSQLFDQLKVLRANEPCTLAQNLCSVHIQNLCFAAHTSLSNTRPLLCTLEKRSDKISTVVFLRYSSSEL